MDQLGKDAAAVTNIPGVNIPPLRAEDIATLESLRSKLMPIVYNIDVLQGRVRGQAELMSWPEVQKATTSLTTQIRSLQTLLADPNHAKLLASFHPFPIPPYNTETPRDGLVDTLLRKRLDPADETWVTERLRKASELYPLPESWGVDGVAPGATTKKEGDDDDDEDNDNIDEDDDPFPKRVKGTLSTEQIESMWDEGPSIVYKNLEIGADGGYDEEEDEEEGSSDGGDEEMEDVTEKGKEKVEAALPEATPIPLGAMLKFISIGETGL